MQSDDELGQQADELAAPIYVALGDSYSSGTGTRTYTDAACQRSNRSFAVQIANAQGFQLKHVACSGAVIPDVRNNQLAALSSDTALVTISIGGNDAGFSNVITSCARPFVSCSADINRARTFIASNLPALLDGLYNDIRARAPAAHVIVVGYPRLFNGQQCNFAARLSPGEQTDLNATADLLSDTTSRSAAAHGFTYVDPRSPFASHEICSNAEWLNGLSNPVSESYHPNGFGHDEYTTLITARL